MKMEREVAKGRTKVKSKKAEKEMTMERSDVWSSRQHLRQTLKLFSSSCTVDLHRTYTGFSRSGTVVWSLAFSASLPPSAAAMINLLTQLISSA